MPCTSTINHALVCSTHCLRSVELSHFVLSYILLVIRYHSTCILFVKKIFFYFICVSLLFCVMLPWSNSNLPFLIITYFIYHRFVVSNFLALAFLVLNLLKGLVARCHPFFFYLKSSEHTYNIYIRYITSRKPLSRYISVEGLLWDSNSACLTASRRATIFATPHSVKLACPLFLFFFCWFLIPVCFVAGSDRLRGGG
jgi:hypothetical protein